MTTREQKNYEFFKVALNSTIGKEEKKLQQIFAIKDLTGDPGLSLYAAKRQNFLSFCRTVSDNLQNIPAYQGNEKLIDSYQKEYYLNMDSLRKEALKLIAKNQKVWFEKLFTSNFEQLKSLLRSLMISESQSDLFTIERVIQEIELLRYKEGF
jgi:hypothetical protein